MKFIHTADIHLDSPLSDLAAYKNAPADLLRTVTRDAFTRLVDVAIEESVDFMVIAGDLYDGTWRDYNTGHSSFAMLSDSFASVGKNLTHRETYAQV